MAGFPGSNTSFRRVGSRFESATHQSSGGLTSTSPERRRLRACAELARDHRFVTTGVWQGRRTPRTVKAVLKTTALRRDTTGSGQGPDPSQTKLKEVNRLVLRPMKTTGDDLCARADIGSRMPARICFDGVVAGHPVTGAHYNVKVGDPAFGWAGDTLNPA